VDLDPTQLDARYNLAFTAARTGRRNLAREHLERYIELAPADRFRREIAEARELLERL
jgi:cytochrome c-type biogenesis protein CcmH/NrfG